MATMRMGCCTLPTIPALIVRGTQRRYGAGMEARLAAKPRQGALPRLAPLTADELRRVLPWSASKHLVLHEFGDAMDWAARCSFSLASSLCIFRCSQTLAALAALFWIWGPVWAAAFRSAKLRLFFPFAGVWQARVLEVKLTRIPLASSGGTPLQGFFQKLSSPKALLRIVIGDNSPARSQIEIPVSSSRAFVEEGETAELLVLSDRADLSRFKIVQDVYFPRLGIWISATPYLERSAFEVLSLDLKADGNFEKTTSLQDILWDEEAVPSTKKTLQGRGLLLESVNEQDFSLLSKEPGMAKLVDGDELLLENDEKIGERNANYWEEPLDY